MCLRSKACRPVHLAAADDPAFRRCGAAPAAAVHLPLPSGVAARHWLLLCSCGAALAVALHLLLPSGAVAPHWLLLCSRGAALAVALHLLLPSGAVAPRWLLASPLLLQGRCHLPSAVKCTFGPGDRSSSGGRRQARDFCTPWCEAVWPSYPGHAQPVPAALSPSAVCSGCAFCLLLAAVETHRFCRLQSKLATMQPPIKAGYNAASKNWLEPVSYTHLTLPTKA